MLHGKVARRTRRALAAALLLSAVALAVTDGAVAEPAGTPTVVATRAIPSGETLRSTDLRVVRFPGDLRPDRAVEDPAELVGGTVSGSVASGETITTTRLVSHESGRAGTVTVPIRLADAGVAQLLEPGTEVDVVTLGEDSDQGRELASDVTVLTVADDPADAQYSSGADGGPLVLLGVSADAATGLAAAALHQPVTVTLS